MREKRASERVVWRALVAPHSLYQILWCVDSSVSLSLSMSMVPECWHGDECPWHKRGRCLFKHCAPPSVELTGGDVPVEQQLRYLRRASQRLAAAVMWRDGVPISQVVKGTLETMTERTQVIDVTATDYGRAPGAHLGARARTDRRYASAHRATWRPSMSRFRGRRTSTRLPLCLS